MGRFRLSESERSSPPSRLIIHAQSATELDLDEERFCSHPLGFTFSTLVTSIAARHGMAAIVSPDLAAIALPHLDQTAESDLHFLTRLARRYDALIKPAGGYLLVVSHQYDQSVSGRLLPSITLGPGDLTAWRIQERIRWQFRSVEARFRPSDQADHQTITVGIGKPVCRLRGSYDDRYQAWYAARSRLARIERERSELHLTLPGRAEITTHTRLALRGVAAAIDGSWVVTRVVHQMDGNGYQCQVDGRRA